MFSRNPEALTVSMEFGARASKRLSAPNTGAIELLQPSLVFQLRYFVVYTSPASVLTTYGA